MQAGDGGGVALPGGGDGVFGVDGKAAKALLQFFEGGVGARDVAAGGERLGVQDADLFGAVVGRVFLQVFEVFQRPRGLCGGGKGACGAEADFGVVGKRALQALGEFLRGFFHLAGIEQGGGQARAVLRGGGVFPGLAGFAQLAFGVDHAADGAAAHENATEAPETPYWDWPGSLLALLGLVGTTYAIKAAAQVQPPWLQVIASATAGVVFLVLFVRRQRRIAQPLIDFSLLRNRAFATGVAAALMCSIAFIGFQLVFSQWLQLVRAFTPLQAGLFMLPMALASFVSGPLAGAWMARVGSHRVIFTGIAVAVAGLLGVIVLHQGAGVGLVAALALFGGGFGAAVTGASSAIMFNAPEEKAGMAASIEEVSYELGGSLGVALMGSLMGAVYATSLRLDGAQAALLGDHPQIRHSLDEAHIVAEGLPPEVAAPLIDAAGRAFDQAFVVVSIASLVLMALTALALLLWRPQRPGADNA